MKPGSKMRKCIIHFGMHKTGSSSIQHSFFRKLSDKDFHYIDLGYRNASIPIATAFKKNPEKYHIHKRNATSREEVKHLRNKIFKKLKKELSRTDSRNLLLSGEDIEYLDLDEFRALYKFINKAGLHVQAVGYVRDPKGFMESAFQQRVKSGGLSQLNLQSLFPSYSGRFQKFETVLGRENVRYWFFEPSEFPEGCVVRDFCSRLGIKFSPDDIVRMNAGLSLPSLSLLFAYRKYGPRLNKSFSQIRPNNRLVNMISKLQGPKFKLHSSLIYPVLEANRDDMDWMESRLKNSMFRELSKDDNIAVCSEKDLLNIQPEAIQWLTNQLGIEYKEIEYKEITSRQVADWIDLIRIGI